MKVIVDGTDSNGMRTLSIYNADNFSISVMPILPNTFKFSPLFKICINNDINFYIKCNHFLDEDIQIYVYNRIRNYIINHHEVLYLTDLCVHLNEKDPNVVFYDDTED